MIERITDETDRGPELIDILRGYDGCEDTIREALSNPGDKKIEKKSWNRVKDAVEQLYEFYEFSLHYEEFMGDLIEAICTDEPEMAIANNQALIKHFALVFDFAFHFDVEKIMNPNIQNDFSYYRRILSRMKSSSKKKKLTVDEDTANKMSFFFAYPTPMMKVFVSVN